MLSRLLTRLCVIALAMTHPPTWSESGPLLSPDETLHARFIPRQPVHEPRRGNLRLTSVLTGGSAPYPGTHFTVLRDQPGTFGREHTTVMAQEGPGAAAEFDLSADRYRVQARNGAVTVEQSVTVPVRGDIDIDIVLDAGELRLTAWLDAGGKAADRAWFRVLRRDTDPYGQPTLVQVAGDGYGAGARFVLPAGDYVAEAHYGDAHVHQTVSMRAGERRDLELTLDAGRLDLAGTLAAGDDPVGGVRFTLLRATGETPAAYEAVANAGTGDTVSFILPAGDYVARARLDRATTEAPVTITAGHTTSLELPLQAGELLVYATLAGRDDALLDSSFDVTPAAAPARTSAASARGPDNLARFVVPAGTHRVTARHGESTGSAPVIVEPGSSQSLAIGLDAGRVSLRLRGGDPVETRANTWFSIYCVERDANGRERRRRVYNAGYHATKDIVLPSGDYIAQARAGSLRGQSRFTVDPGKLIRVDIVAVR